MYIDPDHNTQKAKPIPRKYKELETPLNNGQLRRLLNSTIHIHSKIRKRINPPIKFAAFNFVLILGEIQSAGSKAIADRMNTTQPNAWNILQANLKTGLIERDGRKFKLTAKGRAIYYYSIRELKDYLKKA